MRRSEWAERLLSDLSYRMDMKILSVSHLDHGLSEAQVQFIRERFADRCAFFIETIELPEELGTVPCGLYGPVMGDEPVPEDEVSYARRGSREWTSRMCDRPLRPARQVSVIAGPHEDHECVLYTAFGGPVAPREPADPACAEDDQLAASREFWSQHALSREVG